MLQPGQIGGQIADAFGTAKYQILNGIERGSTFESYGEFFRKRLFAERARLEFFYGFDYPRIYLPFYENPKISERQSPNYATYTPIGRPGNLNTYLGANSRKIRVEFQYTLDHLAFHPMGISRFFKKFNDKDQKRKQFFTSLNDSDYSPSLSRGFRRERLAKYLELYPISPLARTATLDPFKAAPNVEGNPFGALGDTANVDQQAIDKFLDNVPVVERDSVIDSLLLFINTIRSSVLNNVEDPNKGPPLIRLYFGTLYNAVPLICKDYSISFENDVTYDTDTITPKVLSISLDLEEVRVGNFGKFDAYSKVPYLNENIVGWEAVLNEPLTFNKVPNTVEESGQFYNSTAVSLADSFKFHTPGNEELLDELALEKLRKDLHMEAMARFIENPYGLGTNIGKFDSGKYSR